MVEVCHSNLISLEAFLKLCLGSSSKLTSNQKRKLKRNLKRCHRKLEVCLVEGKCKICDRQFKELKDICHFQFHHPDTRKGYNISALWEYSDKVFYRELNACIFVCNDCHSELDSPTYQFIANIIKFEDLFIV